MAGNAAVQQLAFGGHRDRRARLGEVAQAQRSSEPVVQRQGFDPGKLKVPDLTPSFAGTVTAAPRGAKIQMDAPTVRFGASVSADVPSGGKFEDLSAGNRVDVGPTQTLLGSERVGVYRRGGTPNGALVGEMKSHVGQVRDAQTDPDTKKVMPNVVPPWYSVPQSLNAGTTHVVVDFVDKPGEELPIKRGEGTITETRGKDRFRTSLAAKPETGGLYHLKQFNWEIPWDMKIDAAQGGKGGQGKSEATKEIPPTLDGPIAGEVAETWMAFVTADEAMKLSSDILLRYLGPASQHDPAAFWTIVEALRRKNPTFFFDLNVKKSGNVIFDESVTVRVNGPSKVAQKEMGKVDTDVPGAVSFSLLEILEPGEIQAKTTLAVDVIKDSKDTKTIMVPYPFQTLPAEDVRLGGSTYSVTWRLMP